ncbi:MAG: apolipoprotein acyltransferase, partial [Methylocystis sp.]|nr:apolipoprotein acyltransferase [Methylocystis sp.]
LRAELPAVLDQLSQTNVSLQTIVDAARTYLASLETDLNRRLQEFHGAMGAVATQINQIGDVAGGTMRDASAVVGAIEEQHKSLSQSAGRLAQSQGALDQALDARKRALENLVVMIEDKRSDFEGVLSGFSDMVENSLRHVEAGARDIGGFLTQSTQETAHLVDERFAEVRAAAAKERERTAAAMRAAYDQANSELTQTFGHASEKFAAAAAEIRGLASEIQRELEATRVEVRRGAVELPRETAEQASALRRVVGDQVRALNELTDIVARSGRVYDIAEPTAPPPPRSFEAPGAAPLFARARSEPPQPAEPAWRATRPLPPLSTDGALENRGDQGGQGWLSGLLARASRDEAAAPRRSAPSRDAGALDSLTLDIARMVDHAAVVDLWERFQRGERGGLFGRRLYTAQGLRTYEEIRRRYRSDLEFHATVDHYIQEFERLLMETSRNDPDGSQARSYLASDAGKVYTMLSHASGRFD